MGAREHRDAAGGGGGAGSGGANVRCAVLTVSDTRTAEDDRSGALAAEMASGAGHAVVDRAVVRDDVDAIRARVRALIERPDVDVILVTGGTGVAPRDVTPEALAPLFDKPLDGFGELFRTLSWREVGPAAMLSRATAGVCGDKVLFAMPGSPAAVRLALERLVLPELRHVLWLVRGGRPESTPGAQAPQAHQHGHEHQHGHHHHHHHGHGHGHGHGGREGGEGDGGGGSIH